MEAEPSGLSWALPAEPSALLLWCLQASQDPIAERSSETQDIWASLLPSVCQVLVLTEAPFRQVSRRIMQLSRKILTKPHTQFCGKWFCFHQSMFFAGTLLTFLHCVHVSHPLLSHSSPFPFFQPLRAWVTSLTHPVNTFPSSFLLCFCVKEIFIVRLQRGGCSHVGSHYIFP